MERQAAPRYGPELHRCPALLPRAAGLREDCREGLRPPDAAPPRVRPGALGALRLRAGQGMVGPAQEGATAGQGRPQSMRGAFRRHEPGEGVMTSIPVLTAAMPTERFLASVHGTPVELFG
mmetsp:Transcript_100232/g.283853  ORF Transcript_100232/g.283853 Transcript_100232/m.283853 type:complete len:121 (+) Transcript_100232:1503-1865(+)